MWPHMPSAHRARAHCCASHAHRMHAAQAQDYERLKAPAGRVLLVAYYVTRATAQGGSPLEFTVHAYPHVRRRALPRARTAYLLALSL